MPSHSKNKSNARLIPTVDLNQMRVMARFQQDERFVYHTLVRVCAEVLKIEYGKAATFADGMIDAGLVVHAAKVGLTETPTFKLSEQ